MPRKNAPAQSAQRARETRSMRPPPRRVKSRADRPSPQKHPTLGQPITRGTPNAASVQSRAKTLHPSHSVQSRGASERARNANTNSKEHQPACCRRGASISRRKSTRVARERVKCHPPALACAKPLCDQSRVSSVPAPSRSPLTQMLRSNASTCIDAVGEICFGQRSVQLNVCGSFGTLRRRRPRVAGRCALLRTSLNSARPE